MKLLLLIITVSLLGFWYITSVFPNTVVTKQDFIVNRGETIANLPKKLGINVNPTLFKIYTRLAIKNFPFQAGTYSIEKDTTIKGLFDQVLKNPISKDITITLLPGWNIWDMDAYLTKQGIIQAGDFTKSAENITDAMRKEFPFLGKVTTLEGFLVPDTYRISPEASTKMIIQTLLKAFNDKIYNEFNFTSDAKLYETLIFASIVEKEEKNSANKPIVAGILQKRYAERWFIGADATVCYAYRLTMNDCTPVFIGEHIYEKTPYNTRNNLNLPPTPIANPSVDTIRATVNSEPSKYYYYLHDSDGVIHYAKNEEEHNRNRVLYLGK
ncbi:MAG: endolytic transglycosylase MltG [Candidatus Gracilibacteria bacterium]|nr:endolytic transglycosylase MltG [Candidatus Gracilibacteria bacterium]